VKGTTAKSRTVRESHHRKNTARKTARQKCHIEICVQKMAHTKGRAKIGPNTETEKRFFKSGVSKRTQEKRRAKNGAQKKDLFPPAAG